MSTDLLGQLRELEQRWRQSSDSWKKQGRMYQQQRSIGYARECYGRMHEAIVCADELATVLARQEQEKEP